MITRIVKLEFEKKDANVFLNYFNENKLKINSFDGCLGMKMLRDTNEDGIFFTFSLWRSVDDLNKYRNSSLFKTTWSSIKPFFKTRPKAWTLSEYFNGFEIKP